MTPLTIQCAWTKSDQMSPGASPAPTASEESSGMLRALHRTRGAIAGQFTDVDGVQPRERSRLNTPRAAAVEALDRRGPRGAVALATLLLSCGLHGCINVSGGAVELSWSLEDLDGVLVPQGCPDEVENIRLWWQTEEGLNGTSFLCTNNRGVTSFEVPSGEALLWVAPECAGGIAPAPATYVSPPPILRTIAVGDVVELHAVVLQLAVPSVTVNCAATACVCATP